MDYKAKYEQWCQDPIFDKETKAELSAIAGDEKEIEDRFYKDLSFGTGGLRAGPEDYRFHGAVYRQSSGCQPSL